MTYHVRYKGVKQWEVWNYSQRSLEGTAPTQMKAWRIAKDRAKEYSGKALLFNKDGSVRITQVYRKP